VHLILYQTLHRVPGFLPVYRRLINKRAIVIKTDKKQREDSTGPHNISYILFQDAHISNVIELTNITDQHQPTNLNYPQELRILKLK